jgi:hypothetical protein
LLGFASHLGLVFIVVVVVVVIVIIALVIVVGRGGRLSTLLGFENTFLRSL